MNDFRRRYLYCLTSLFGLPFVEVLVSRSEALGAGNSSDSARAEKPLNRRFIESATEMRRLAIEHGDQAYGAVIVRAGQIVGEAPSRVVVNQDPTAHAEMEAIRDAARRLGTRDLTDCVMYSTSRPCAMCEAAAYWAHIDRLFFGMEAQDGGAPRLGRC